MAGGLFLVATPIGNLKDITLRALEVLGGADLVLCEDTRTTGKLLSAHGLKAKLRRYDDHAREKDRDAVLAELRAGLRIALVSDAGTPLISDPGYKLVRAVAEAGLPVTALPGPSALLTALQLSALPSDRFFFAGFLPPKSGARRGALTELRALPGTLVFYESGPRLAASLVDMAEVLGDRRAAVARELTKLFEEVKRERLSALAGYYQANPPKGEIVVVVEAPSEGEGASNEIEVEAALRAALEHHSLRDAVDAVATASGRPRKEVYALALMLSGER